MLRDEMKVTCIKETTPAPVALENIEYRIAIHMQGAYENMLEAVSYTHLDVYKRQRYISAWRTFLIVYHGSIQQSKHRGTCGRPFPYQS